MTYGSNLSVCRCMNGSRYCGTYRRMLFGFKEGDPAICDMDQPEGNYAKGNKPDTGRKTLYDRSHL